MQTQTTQSRDNFTDSYVAKLTSQIFIAAGIVLIIATCAYGQFAKPLLPHNNEAISSNTHLSPISPTSESASNFQTEVNPIRTTVLIYSNTKDLSNNATSESSARHLVLTLRPSLLAVGQICDINGILGINMLSGQPFIDAYASQHQLELIQAVLAPSACDSTSGLAIINNGRKHIASDPTPQQLAFMQRQGDDSIYIYKGPLPSIRTITRLFVVLGIVCATVYLGFAAFSVINGQMHSGSKVLGTAAGVMLLVMAYTIYKVLLVNAIYKTSDNETADVLRHLSNLGEVPGTDRNFADTPIIPLSTSGGIPRSGLKVQPLSGN